ncbi:MAG: aspartate kinase [Candidatus Marinimicrobia bacterium]|nr:aspartate kinase [Candidatus Neomarinimicrobiota bacterium]
MKKIVVKFGGSNLQTDEDLGRLLNIIEAYHQPLIIVISAFYGITNYLQDLIWKVQYDQHSVHAGIQFIRRLKQNILIKNVSKKESQDRILQKIDHLVEELERYLMGIHLIGEIPKQTEELILSYGERLSSLLLTEILNEKGLNAIEKKPEDIKLITTGNFGNAEIDYKASRVAENLSFDTLTVIPGFYGISSTGKVTLLGRGGSDYSAAAIARCMKADYLDIWKDVNGFMSGDPKIVNSPRNLERLTYTEAAELAYFGAKILHPRTVEPLIEPGIPIRIFDVSSCENTQKPRTIISHESQVYQTVIKSVTFSDDFGILQLEGPGVGMKPGILAHVTQALDKATINIKSVITAQTSINILLSLHDLDTAYEVTRKVISSVVSGLKIFKDISLIAVVGHGILETPGVAARIFGAVSRKNINIKIISVGASPVAAYFIVDKSDRDRAVKTIHEEFFP